MSISLKTITDSQSKDSGLALVLISLLLAVVISPEYFLPAGIVILVATMAVPRAFRPFALVWLKLSNALGMVSSKILLTLLYYLLVTPVGSLRRMLGKDTMQFKAWKTSQDSVFKNRDQIFIRKDLDHPY